MFSKKWHVLIVVLVIGSTLLTACAQPAPEVQVREVEVTRVVEVEGETVTEVETVTEIVEVTAVPKAGEDLVTLDINAGTDIPGLDPQRAEDVWSINAIESLFVGLTDIDDATGEVLPELATSWEQTVNEDGTADWTFHLRDDINWVYYNPVTEETSVVRPVTAQDVVYAVQRACSPAIGTYYSHVVGSFVLGCEDYLSYDPEAEDALPLEEVLANVGAEAPDDTTVVFHLLGPVGFWPTVAGMWTIRPVPQETIEEFDARWVEPGNIVTNGPYVLGEWIHSVSTVFLKNPHWTGPYTGNVEKVQIHYINDVSTGFALFLDNGLDVSAIPVAELEAFKAESPERTTQFSDLAVWYVSMIQTRPPFDDQRVREAFAWGMDRQAFIDVARGGEGVVMTHIAPPGMFGAPPINEVGVGYDPEKARALLAEAGYPDCEGFPTIDFLVTSSDRVRMWAETYAAIFSESLGCPIETFNIIQQEFRVYLATLDESTPDAEMPHLWNGGWGPDYSDEDNWVRALFHCEDSENNQRRECSEVDDLIKDLQFELDPQVRIDGYRQVESMFFDEGGIFPAIPVWLLIETQGEQTWLDRVQAVFGGQHYNSWNIDWEAKKAAQSQ